MSKFPSFQFYPGDYMKDPAIRSCSLQSRGLWLDMLCLMHESPRRGYLQHKNGQPINNDQLARIVGAALDVVLPLLQELENSGVFSRSPHGTIYSRRVVRDERVRKSRALGGKLGGNPRLKEVNYKVNLTPNLFPTPSSSPSSSYTTSKVIPPISPFGGGFPSEFEAFWDVYPNHKCGKSSAYKSWSKINPNNELIGIIMSAVRTQKDWPDWVKENGQFIPMATTWLNNRRWDADLVKLESSFARQDRQKREWKAAGLCVRCGGTLQIVDMDDMEYSKCKKCLASGDIIRKPENVPKVNLKQI